MTEAEELELLELEAEAAGAKPVATAKDSSPKSASEAALQGLGQGASFGYLPELQAATYPVVEAIGKIITGNKDISSDTYAQRLQQNQARDERLQAANPVAYTGGNLAGAVALPIPGLGAVKGAEGMGALAKLGIGVGRGALTGGALGAVQNVPRGTPSMNEDLGANLRQRLEQAKTGALFGGTIGGAAEAIPLAAKAMKPVQEHLTGKIMGLGGQAGKAGKIKPQMKKLESFMSEEGMLKPGSTPKSVLDKTEKILQDTGDNIGVTYNKVAKDANISQVAPLNSKELAQNIIDQAKAQLDNGSISDTTFNAVVSESERLGKHGNDISELLRYRRGLDDRLSTTYKKGQFADLSEKEEALKAVRGAVKHRVDTHIEDLDKLSNSDNSRLLKKLNEKYSSGSMVKEVADKYVSKGQAKGILPELLIGTIAGAGAYDSNDPIKSIGKGLGVAATVGLGRKYGPGIGYAASKLPEDVGKVPLGRNTVLRGSLVPWLKMKEGNK